MPAEPASVRAPRRKRWLRRLLLALLFGPPLLLGLVNLALATPWAKRRVATEIHRRCGFEAELGSLTLTPWGGAAIGDLRLLQPPALRVSLDRPLLELRCVRVIPRWWPLFRGDLQVAEILVECPRAAVALEMLGSLAAAGKPQPPAEAPPLALASAPDAPAPIPGEGAPEAPAPLSGEGAPVSPPVSPAPEAGQASPASPPPPAPPPSAPRATTWLKITEGDLDFFLGGKKVGGLSSFGGRVPIGGGPATGSFAAQAAEVLGWKMFSDPSMEVSWSDPTLRIVASDLVLAGVKLQVEAIAGRVRGYPFQLAVRAKDQSVDLAGVLPNSQVGYLNLGLQAQGFLMAPAGWRGLAAFRAHHLSLTVGDNPTLLFGEASAQFLMQGGNIACPDLRVIGETVSFLGNGSIRGGEGISLVLRAVMPPDKAQAWQHRSELVGAAVPAVFSDMGALGRVFIDLRWVSYPGGQGIEFGSGGPVLPPDKAFYVFGTGS